jgi:2'-5' RNA ligase
MTQAIVTFPDINNINVIEQLRHKYDPLATIIPAHITLGFPFHSPLSKSELQREVEKAVQGMNRFHVELREITACQEEYLFLNVTGGKNELIELQERLYSGIPLDKESFLDQGFIPHITIGRIQDRLAFSQAFEEVQKLATNFYGFVNKIIACHVDGLFQEEFSVPLR